MDLTETLTLIQTILSGVGIVVSIAIFILGIKIANNSKYKEEYGLFYEIFKQKSEKLNSFKFINYNAFIKKLKSLKKMTLDEISRSLSECITEECLLIFLEIAKEARCITWNGNREAESEVEIIDYKKIVRLAKKLYENINTR